MVPLPPYLGLSLQYIHFIQSSVSLHALHVMHLARRALEALVDSFELPGVVLGFLIFMSGVVLGLVFFTSGVTLFLCLLLVAEADPSLALLDTLARLDVLDWRFLEVVVD